MNRIKTCTAITTAFLLFMMAVPAFADPIEGSWKTQSGETAAIAKCGGSYCIKLKTGKYAGKSIGKMNGANGKYKGTVIKPSTGKKYSGSASISGTTMKMKGCVALVLCETQTWKRL